MKQTLLVLAASIMPLVSAPARPNLLLITGDDLGFQLGCYGDTAAHTPHMDRLAHEGARFTRGYVTQASCSPSRSSMLTGLYPHQNGHIGLGHLGYALNSDRIPTLPGQLKRAGYYTGVIGKIHVSPDAIFPFDYKETNTADTRNLGKVRAKITQFLEETQQQPFFLMLNFFDPHDPHLLDIEGSPKVKTDVSQIKLFPWLPDDLKNDKSRQRQAEFQTCINRMDEGVGIALELLRAKGKAENTLVVLIGDNGPPFTRAKVSSFEAGVNVPFIAWWPGKIRGGQVSEKLVCTTDLMPTFLSLAGAETPDGLPGASLWPLLQGENVPWRDLLATEYTTHEPRSFNPQRSIRDARYKLTITLLKKPEFAWPEGITMESFRKLQARAGTGDWIELYDLKEDPCEFKNLADDPGHQAVRKRLWNHLQEWREATRDPLLDDNALRALIKQHENAPPTPVPAWKKAKAGTKAVTK
jgi:N-sulfoglucosamine sulfohydrolase